MLAESSETTKMAKATRKTREKKDVYADVTNSIIAAIEAGQTGNKWTLPWQSAASGGIPRNVASKKMYRGINVPLLWGATQQAGHTSPVWGTYKQWQEKGCQVRKGEKATSIVLWKSYERKTEGSDKVEKGMFARHFSVFNASQVDGYEAPEQPAAQSEIERNAQCDDYVAATGADIRHGEGRAFYAPGPDYIGMPQPHEFIETDTASATENYYSTLLHELTHWTGSDKRTKRINDNSKATPRRQAYAFEELVAELGATMLCATLGVEPQPRDDHARYIDSWLKALKDDKRLIFSAASQAQKAIDYLDGLQAAEELPLAA